MSRLKVSKKSLQGCLLAALRLTPFWLARKKGNARALCSTQRSSLCGEDDAKRKIFNVQITHVTVSDIVDISLAS
jgi:hypothetical protein